MFRYLTKAAKWTFSGAGQEKIVLLGLFIVATVLLFYNLEYNPRTWHDEGGALSLSRTIVEDGFYGVRSADDYQTFGPVQSVGPTVILPVALSFRLLGVGLIQGRIVAAIYTLFALAVFYGMGRELFGHRVALLTVVLLLGSQAAGFLRYGRQVLGEIPALGLFIAGWWAWSRGAITRRSWLYPIAGLLIGAAMITKSQYVVLGFGALGLAAILDLIYYRQGNFKSLIVLGVVAGGCVALWLGWQLTYFGRDTFQDNIAKLRLLAESTTGFDPRLTAEAVKFLMGSESDHFYHLWGFPALVYAGMLSFRRNRQGSTLAFLVIFTILWLAYYLFWITPWKHYVAAATGISALFVSKLWYDLTSGFCISWRALWTEIRQGHPAATTLRLTVLATLFLMIFYPLQSRIRSDVLVQYRGPQQVALFLNATVDKNAVVETWERELAVLTDHRYHFPDQIHLAETHPAAYRGGKRHYTLGAAYFQEHQPRYIVVGWYARLLGIYDIDFLIEHGDLLATIEEYEVYELHLP